MYGRTRTIGVPLICRRKPAIRYVSHDGSQSKNYYNTAITCYTCHVICHCVQQRTVRARPRPPAHKRYRDRWQHGRCSTVKTEIRIRPVMELRTRFPLIFCCSPIVRRRFPWSSALHGWLSKFGTSGFRPGDFFCTRCVCVRPDPNQRLSTEPWPR